MTIIYPCGCQLGEIQEDPNQLGYWREATLCPQHSTEYRSHQISGRLCN